MLTMVFADYSGRREQIMAISHGMGKSDPNSHARASRLLIARGLGRAMHPGRAVKRAVTPKVVKGPAVRCTLSTIPAQVRHAAPPSSPPPGSTRQDRLASARVHRRYTPGTRAARGTPELGLPAAWITQGNRTYTYSALIRRPANARTPVAEPVVIRAENAQARLDPVILNTFKRL
jgi:hypothetical protein